MLYIFELASHWNRFRVIPSSVARDMIVSVREIQSAKKLDLRALIELLGILYLELRLELFMEYNRLSEGYVKKNSELLEMFKGLIFFV